MNLTLPCLLYLIITILLLLNTFFLYDKVILFIMIIGQCILLYSNIYKNNILIEISHIIYFITIVLGALFFKDIKNILFLLIILLITLLSRYYYKECLFNISSNNTIIININMNFNNIYIILLGLVLCKLVYI